MMNDRRQAQAAKLSRASDCIGAESIHANDRKWDSVVEYCTAEGLAFLPWSPLGAGKIARDHRVDEVAKRHGVSALTVAIAWLLARSPAMLVIPGMSSVAHLEENIAAGAMGLSSEDIALLD